MAAVDSLLRFIAARNAEGLTIRADAVPELRKGGMATALSMPPLSSLIVVGFLEEIGGPTTRHYTSADGSHFAVSVQGHDEGLQMSFTSVQAGSRANATPATTAAAAIASLAPSTSLVDTVPSTPLAGGLDTLLQMAVELNASDLVLSSDCNAWARVDGQMRALPQTAMSAEEILSALDVDAAHLDEHGCCDFALVRGQRYRVNLFRQNRGIGAALRPIRSQAPTLEELHLPRSLGELARLRNGLVLVAGAAGSGKSTTLAALIEELNRSQSRHVITLEDPIEYEYENGSCLIHQREIGKDVASFAQGLRSALRESPDIILVGEMRDRETMAAAVTAAETGHLVFGTIHASSASVAIDRMIDVFPSGQQRQIRYQLASTLRATLTQFLVPSPVPPGRMPAIELMRCNDAVAANIREGKTHQLTSAIQTGRAQGMIALEHSLANLVRDGLVTYEEALACAKESEFFRQLAR